MHGGFIGWTYEHLGIFSFTNELWNNDQLLGRTDPPAPGQTLARAVGASGEADQLFANDRLLFGAQFVPWKPAKHPLYGDIEIGGFVKQSQRVPPPFLIEELCHRNAAFAIYHADQMPRIAWDEVRGRSPRPRDFRRLGLGPQHPEPPQRLAAGRAAEDRPARHPEPRGRPRERRRRRGRHEPRHGRGPARRARTGHTPPGRRRDRRRRPSACAGSSGARAGPPSAIPRRRAGRSRRRSSSPSSAVSRCIYRAVPVTFSRGREW